MLGMAALGPIADTRISESYRRDDSSEMSKHVMGHHSRAFSVTSTGVDVVLDTVALAVIDPLSIDHSNRDLPFDELSHDSAFS